MECRNESTELRRHPLYNIMLHAKDVDDTNHMTLTLTGQQVSTVIKFLFFSLKNGPIPASFFVYFRSFLITISIQIEKA